MIIDNKLYLDILRCDEYQLYCLRKPNQPHGVYIDFKSLPKAHYLPIGGDYVKGLMFSQELNEAEKDNGLVFIIPFSSTPQPETQSM